MDTYEHHSSTGIISLAMETTTAYRLGSQQIPSDVIVHVRESSFSLHKLMLLAKSNYVRKLVLESGSSDLSRLDFSDIPGGPETFEKAAKFCYGVNFEITVYNVAALRCAADYLEMSDEYCDNNLIGRTADFLSQVALQTLTGATVVLKSCEELLPAAVDIVRKCVEVASAKACVEADFPNHSPLKWRMEDLSILGIAFFSRVIDAMRSRGVKGITLASAIMAYTESSLGGLVRDHSEHTIKSSYREESCIRPRQRELLEAIVALTSSEKSLFPVNFLCCLLRCSIFLRASDGCKNELEKRISAVLDHVTIDELLMLSFTYDGEKLCDLDSVKRVIAGFVAKERSVGVFNIGDSRKVPSTAMQQVAMTVDAYLSKIAIYEELSITKFNGIANLIAKDVRKSDDTLYRAIDIYLKAHPHLDELEREKACSALDPHKLSHEARAHASQNKRLPVQVVVHALYYKQLKVRSGMEDDDDMPDAESMRNQVQADVCMAKENEALRTELLAMKMYIQDLQNFTQEKSARSSERRLAFLSSMSKTLGRWNPFNKNESKDTLSINDGVVDLTKSRKRRFSIS